MNRVLKATAIALLRSDAAKERKRDLRKLLPYFKGVSAIDLCHVDWRFQYDRNNQTYRLLMFICNLVANSYLLHPQESGNRLSSFLDDQSMCHHYEKFILSYYQKEHPELEASSAQIPWSLDDGVDTHLPVMQSDVMLRQGGRTLNIDAKYYAQTMQENFNVRTIHSGNLYQIFTYVKNAQETMAPGFPAVAGMLLYAKTDEDVVPADENRMNGNHIEVRTLDLSGDFSSTRRQLDGIAEKYFPVHFTAK